MALKELKEKENAEVRFLGWVWITRSETKFYVNLLSQPKPYFLCAMKKMKKIPSEMEVAPRYNC